MYSTIIGAGRLGKNIAVALSHADDRLLYSICNQSMQSAQKACLEIGFGTPVNNIAQLEQCEILMITCPDDSIQSVVKQLQQYPILKPGSIVVHCSGVLDSSILFPLKAQSCFVASFHPLKAFKQDYLNVRAFDQVPCIIEGDDEACKWLTTRFEALNAQVINIDSKAKAKYHAAACIASNYLITLAACSEDLFLEAGISPDLSRQMLCQLMQGNVDNLKQAKPIAETLTGPLMRGDMQTLALHLQALEKPEIKVLYQAVALATLDFTLLSDERKQAVKELLENECI
jgi:predicted short-subunit dehydrogenase-like oxidoreductase (DUF2520 family)